MILSLICSHDSTWGAAALVLADNSASSPTMAKDLCLQHFGILDPLGD